MILRQLFDPASWTYTYIVGDSESREALIVDPVLECLERDLKLAEELGLTIRFTADTHVHADHVTASGHIRDKLGAVSIAGSKAGVSCADRPLEHGETFNVGGLEFECRHTPGHTAGCVSYILSSGNFPCAFTGDTLLVRGCGRTDFQEGDAATLYQSVHSQLFILPDSCVVYPAHDYRGHHSSTIGEEKRFNPRLHHGVSLEQFTVIMNNLNLPDPKQMDVAVSANQACGMSEA